MKRAFHDLSVLFDDDGKVYVVWNYQNVHFAQLDSTLTDIVLGSERVVIPASAGMGEGSHFYKIDGKYYITSAWYAGRMRLACARADRPEGPYEVNRAISADEDFGLVRGYRLRSDSAGVFQISPPDTSARGQISFLEILHPRRNAVDPPADQGIREDDHGKADHEQGSRDEAGSRHELLPDVPQKLGN